MKNGMTLQEVAVEVERQDKSKRDFIIPPSLMTMSVAENQIVVRLPKKDGTNELFGVNRTAHDQLAQYLAIPGDYYRRMQEQAPALLASNVNRWLGDRNKPEDARLIRCLDGNVRAVLSDRYRALDNIDLAKVILPIITKYDFNVESCNINDRHLYLKVVSKSVKVDIQPGNHVVANDPIHFGLSFSNSEIGFGTLNIEEILYRLVCKNGLIAESLTSRRHVGAKNSAGDGNWELFSDETKRQTDAAFWAQVKDVVEASVREAKDRFDKLVAKIDSAKQQPIQPLEVIELVKEKYNLTDGEGTGILQHLIKGADLSLWGLVNAVTAFAQDASLDYERATDFERLGGKLLKANAEELAAA